MTHGHKNHRATGNVTRNKGKSKRAISAVPPLTEDENRVLMQAWILQRQRQRMTAQVLKQAAQASPKRRIPVRFHVAVESPHSAVPITLGVLPVTIQFDFEA